MKNIILYQPDLIKEAGDRIREMTVELKGMETSSSAVKRKPGGKDREGRDLFFDYVDDAYMIDMLDDRFPGWSWEIENISILGNEGLVCTGTLTIMQCGLIRRMSGEGGDLFQRSSSKGTLLAPEHRISSASTKALKKAASRLGICADVYRQDLSNLIEKFRSLADHPAASEKTMEGIQRFLSVERSWKEIQTTYEDWKKKLDLREKEKSDA